MAMHPSELIVEEMRERRWSRDVLAAMMCDDDDVMQYHVNRLAVQMYIDVGPSNRGILLGEMASKFARALGVSEEMLLNLERAWLDGEAPSGDSPKG